MQFKPEDLVLVCIGSANNILDSLGPRVGTYIKEHTNIEVYGTMEEPIHALNLSSFLKSFHPRGKTVIGIDACIGKDYGKVIFREGPIKPGSGVKKVLPSVGDYSIRVVVATSEYELFIHEDEQAVLSYVVNMIKYIESLVGGNIYENGQL